MAIKGKSHAILAGLVAGIVALDDGEAVDVADGVSVVVPVEVGVSVGDARSPGIVQS